MAKLVVSPCNRRSFILTGLGGLAWVVAPAPFGPRCGNALAGETGEGEGIRAVVREEALFAGIRKPIKSREELEPRIQAVKAACGDRIAGPLTHIFRFDTPVDGFDSEIGFPVSAPVEAGDVKSHTLRQMHFYSLVHEGPDDGISETRGKLYQFMNTTGLSPELETVEIFHHRDSNKPESSKTEVLASFLAWPEVYRKQLVRVLGEEKTETVWSGGESLTPHTLVDPRAAWVGESLQRLKNHSTRAQQFDVLSRVALVRPLEDVEHYREIYRETKDPLAVFRAQDEKLQQGRTGGFLDPMRYDGKTLHMSKVPYNRKAYDEAKSQKEKREAYCFCNLVREAEDPKIDPIFCYRAAGWARQFWEPILGVEFKDCKITHSILKGDGFCAWDYQLA